MAEQQVAYTLELYSRQVLRKKEYDYKNLAMSPLSIAMALAMTATGARGATLEQMISHLKHKDGLAMHQFSSYTRNTVLRDGSLEGGPRVDFSSCVLVDNTLPLDGAYRQVVKESYGAEAESVDFRNQAESIRLQVNQWVSQKTRGKIEELFPPGSVTPGSKLLLANALYFKGSWEFQFDPAGTRLVAFYLLNGKTVSVPMMTSRREQCITNCGTFKVLKLAYRRGNSLTTDQSNNFSMYILLPNQRDGLPELEKHLDATAASWLMQHLPEMRTFVPTGLFLVPRFNISYGLEASDLLKSLGLTWPFQLNADFSGILGKAASDFDPLCVSQVFHKVSVQVDEEGTVASAATGVTMVFGSRQAPGHVEDFVADHPFLCLIRDDVTGVIMFIGRVANPWE